jgi:hypothetical protein
MRDRRGAYKVLVGKSKGKRPLGRPRRRREYRVETNFQEVVLGYRLVSSASG